MKTEFKVIVVGINCFIFLGKAGTGKTTLSNHVNNKQVLALDYNDFNWQNKFIQALLSGKTVVVEIMDEKYLNQIEDLYSQYIAINSFEPGEDLLEEFLGKVLIEAIIYKGKIYDHHAFISEYNKSMFRVVKRYKNEEEAYILVVKENVEHLF